MDRLLFLLLCLCIGLGVVAGEEEYGGDVSFIPGDCVNYTFTFDFDGCYADSLAQIRDLYTGDLVGEVNVTELTSLCLSTIPYVFGETSALLASTKMMEETDAMAETQDLLGPNGKEETLSENCVTTTCGVMNITDPEGNVVFSETMPNVDGGSIFSFSLGEPDCLGEFSPVRIEIQPDLEFPASLISILTTPEVTEQFLMYGPVEMTVCLRTTFGLKDDIEHIICFYECLESVGQVSALLTSLDADEIVLFDENVTVSSLTSANISEACYAIGPIATPPCDRDNSLISLVFDSVPYAIESQLSWRIISADSDFENVTVHTSGTGLPGCSICLPCGTYFAIVESCEGNGLQGGTFSIKENFITLNSSSPDSFSFTETKMFSIECNYAPTAEPFTCPYNHKKIEVVYDQDDKPEETLLTLVDMTNGEVVHAAQSGFRYCIDLGREWSVNLIDCGGDGICCSSGFGSYGLLFDETTLLDTAGNFGSYHGYFIGSDLLLPFASAFPTLSPSSSPTTFAVEFIEILVYPSQIALDHFEVAILTRLNFDRTIAVAVGEGNNDNPDSGLTFTSVDEGTSCSIISVPFTDYSGSDSHLNISGFIMPEGFNSQSGDLSSNFIVFDTVQVDYSSSFVYTINEPLPEFICFPPSAAPTAEPASAPTPSPSVSPTFEAENIELRVFPPVLSNKTGDEFQVAVFIGPITGDRVIYGRVLGETNTTILAEGNTTISQGDLCLIFNITNLLDFDSEATFLEVFIIPESVTGQTLDERSERASGSDIASVTSASNYTYIIDEPIPDYICYEPSAAPSEEPSVSPTYSLDTLEIRLHPSQIIEFGNETFQVALVYDANSDRVAIVDIIGPAPARTWYGKGVANASFEDSCVIVTVNASIPIPHERITLTAKLVPTSLYDANPSDSWRFATSDRLVGIDVGMNTTRDYTEPLDSLACFAPSMAPSAAPSNSPTKYGVPTVIVKTFPTEFARFVNETFPIAIEYELTEERVILFDILASDYSVWYGGFTVYVSPQDICATGNATIVTEVPEHTSVYFKAAAVPVDQFEADPPNSWVFAVASNIVTSTAEDATQVNYPAQLQDCEN